MLYENTSAEGDVMPTKSKVKIKNIRLVLVHELKNLHDK